MQVMHNLIEVSFLTNSQINQETDKKVMHFT